MRFAFSLGKPCIGQTVGHGDLAGGRAQQPAVNPFQANHRDIEFHLGLGISPTRVDDGYQSSRCITITLGRKDPGPLNRLAADFQVAPVAASVQNPDRLGVGRQRAERRGMLVRHPEIVVVLFVERVDEREVRAQCRKLGPQRPSS